MIKSKAIAFAFILAFSLHSINVSFAQKTTIYLHEDAEFKTGLELFEKQKYGAAQKSFLRTIHSHTDPQSLVRIDAEYYSAICAIELFNKDAEILLKKFIKDHPESPKVKPAYFYMGKYNYRKKKYNEAIAWLEKADVYDLDKETLPEFYFKRGYSYFETEQTEKAKKDFYEIKDIDTKYTAPANYYYSHIAYADNNYEVALLGFLKLSKNELFGPIIPYYIAQIYFIQGKYNEVISYAPPLLDSANAKRAPEIARIIGESYYKTSRFKESIPYLKRYERAAGHLSRKDMYQLAYAYYKSSDIDNAIVYFKDIVSEEDTLTQNAYYHLADCFIRKGNKPFARNAFEWAAKLNFDEQIKEDALFSYAKLCYELSFSPFNEAITAFQTYIKEYPNSPRVNDAYEYLTKVYLTTKNYKEALTSIESISPLNEQLKPVYQKIAFYRGVDVFNNSDMNTSIVLFDKALLYKYEKNINALAFYWKGEAFYRKKMYENAIENYKAFISEPGALNTPEYNTANYNIGYSFFRKNDFTSALLWFRKYVSSKDGEPNNQLNDAYLRIGDSYFMTKDYSGAVENYNEAIKIKAFDTDYALYQKAMALGLMKKHEAKVENLLNLLKDYPKSNYTAATNFELGKTYLVLNESEKALNCYKKITTDFPNSSYYHKALLQTGLILFNKKEDDKALEAFDKLVRIDRKSTEAEEALDFIKRIFVSKNDVDGLENYFNEVSASIPAASLDSVTYEIGKGHYLEKDCENATKDFSKYITKFPDGIFILDANFYKAECEYKAGHEKEALEAYNFIVDKNKNNYTEPSLVNAAIINYKNKNYQEALKDYTQLEIFAEYPNNKMNARIGKMRCNFLLKNFDAAIQSVNEVLSTEKIPVEIISEAHLTSAKSLLETEKYDEALDEFRITVNTSKNKAAAEAKYNVAYILFLKEEYKESEKVVFELINQEPSYPYWITKGLILLADNYAGVNDKFQAKHTLKNVIENSDDAELLQQAKRKLELIEESEKTQIQKFTPEELKIEFKDNNFDFNKLIDEPVKEGE